MEMMLDSGSVSLVRKDMITSQMNVRKIPPPRVKLETNPKCLWHLQIPYNILPPTRRWHGGTL